METNVVIQYRKEDESLIKAVLQPAIDAYKLKMQKEIDVKLDKDFLPPSPSKAGTGPSWYAWFLSFAFVLSSCCVVLRLFLFVC